MDSLTFTTPRRHPEGGRGRAALVLGTHSEVRGRNADPGTWWASAATTSTRTASGSRAAGVEFVEHPADYGQLRIATLKDPECNVIQLLQPIAG